MQFPRLQTGNRPLSSVSLPISFQSLQKTKVSVKKNIMQHCPSVINFHSGNWKQSKQQEKKFSCHSIAPSHPAPLLLRFNWGHGKEKDFKLEILRMTYTVFYLARLWSSPPVTSQWIWRHIQKAHKLNWQFTRQSMSYHWFLPAESGASETYFDCNPFVKRAYSKHVFVRA